MTPEVATVVIILSIVGGIGLGVAVCFIVPKFREYFANKQRDKILHEAQVKADKIIKNAQIDGKQTVAELKSEAEKEIKERRSEITQTENRLLQREQNIDRRDAILQTKEETLEHLLLMKTVKQFNMDFFTHKNAENCLLCLATKFMAV